jgi:hypothetical protein
MDKCKRGEECADIIMLLMKYGADVDIKNNSEKTPLDLLLWPEQRKVLSLLKI